MMEIMLKGAMDMRSYILFDLDGTLTDPGPGITNSVAYALEKFAIHPQSREELYPYIGPPLTVSFQEYHGLSPQQAETALGYYREYFADKGIFENAVYEGIPAMLERLQNAGATLMVATSKPEEFTHRILEHFDLAKYFAFVGGNTLDEARPTKEAVLRHIMTQYPAISPESTVMVGDRCFDVEGAAAVGLPAVGVLYGYGSRKELMDAGAVVLAKDVTELHKILTKRL